MTRGRVEFSDGNAPFLRHRRETAQLLREFVTPRSMSKKALG
jgi:hypothetical protein